MKKRHESRMKKSLSMHALLLNRGKSVFALYSVFLLLNKKKPLLFHRILPYTSVRNA